MDARILVGRSSQTRRCSTLWSSRKLPRAWHQPRALARVWTKAGLQPHRRRHYMKSDYRDFEAKANDIIGLIFARLPMMRSSALIKRAPLSA